MQWLALDFKTFLTSARLGTLTLNPQNLEKKSNFRFHLKNLEMALVLQNHHQEIHMLILTTIHIPPVPKKRKRPFFADRFLPNLENSKQ